MNDFSFNGSSTTTNPSSGYLWGSSAVWQPWTPYTPPTREQFELIHVPLPIKIIQPSNSSKI
nr:unnamed protein product [Callosobruchus chinensis]